jgi:hypothetical protein
MSMGAAALYANKLFTGFGDSKSLAVQLYTIPRSCCKKPGKRIRTTCGFGYKVSSSMDITELFWKVCK